MFKSSANDIPIGNKRRYGSDNDQNDSSKDHSNPQQAQPRKRKSRWGTQNTETSAILPTAIYNSNASTKQLENYASQMRIEEINNKLKNNTFVPPPEQRSPSPPPTYDSYGKRTNTREIRYKNRLQKERIKLIEKVMKSDSNYRPPPDYHLAKRYIRPTEKIYIPTQDFPHVNFFGLLVGPRGNSLKMMEKESGAKISIRGKGSVKEGKGKADNIGADEDLHCVVSADSDQKVRKCVELINKVIEVAASTPEGQNDHKRSQLRELAALNGTLRDDENQMCQTCGSLGHRRWECPEGENFTASIKCALCGQSGHLSRDCHVKGGQPPQEFDSEYANLMAELGEGNGIINNNPTKGLIEGNTEDAEENIKPPEPIDHAQKWVNAGKKVPPWRVKEIWESANGINQANHHYQQQQQQSMNYYSQYFQQPYSNDQYYQGYYQQPQF